MKGLSKKEVDKDIPNQLPPQERENSGQQKNDTAGGVLNFRMDDYHPIFNSLMTSIQNSKGNSAKSLQPWKQAHLKSLAQALSGKESCRGRTSTNSLGLECTIPASVGTESKAQK